MKDLRIELQLWAASLGRWPIAACAVAAAALLAWGLVLPGMAHRASGEAGLVERLRRARPGHAMALDANAPSADALALFQSTLARPDDPERFMRRLWQQAEHDGLHLSKIDYQHDVDGPGRFARLGVSVPVSGTYPQVRDFAFGLLADFPGLALEKIEIKREQPAQAGVEATLHFTLLERS